MEWLNFRNIVKTIMNGKMYLFTGHALENIS